MWWDLSYGKQSEIEYLNAAVVREAENLGVTCTYNRRIVELIPNVESGTLSIGISGQRLQELLGMNQ